MNDVNIENILISILQIIYLKKCFSCFISYVNHDKKPLIIKFPKSSISIKSFKKVKYMSICLKKKHSYILNIYSEIFDIIIVIIRIDLDVQVIHTDKKISTKIKSFKHKIRTDFCDDGLPSKRTPCTAHLIILINSVYRSDKVFRGI